MARKAVLEGGKRDEILEAALSLFLEHGYESTSIRMILEKVNGEVGMFYHYFTSKQVVFDRAFELFMKKQGEKISFLMERKLVQDTPQNKLRQLVECYDDGMKEYKKLSDNAIHWSVLSALHDLTLEAMLPSFKEMLLELLQIAHKEVPDEIELLSRFIFKGISGVLHDKSFETLTSEEQMRFIIKQICATLAISQQIFE